MTVISLFLFFSWGFAQCNSGVFISFDNARSIEYKVEYAMDNKMAGVMVWQIAQDKAGELVSVINNKITPGKEFVVYFPNYVVTNIRNYQIEDVEALLKKGINITTLIYCFAKPNSDGTVEFDMPDVDEKNREKIQKLKHKFPKLKVLLSIGGWGYKDAFFKAVENNKLKRLAYNCIALIKDTTFDGIDIDWEFDSNEKEFECFKNNYGIFITYVKQAMQSLKAPKIITIALMPNVRFYTEFEGLKGLSERVDWINFMAYNYEGPGWSELTGHNAPLYSPDLPDKRKWKKTEPKFESIHSSVQGFLKAGIKPEKLVLGIPFYGRSFKGVRPGPDYDGLYQIHKGPSKIFSVVGSGSFDYSNLIGHASVSEKETIQSKFKYHWDDTSKVPFLFAKY